MKNIASILANYQDDKLIVVVSAMGKMTNAFEWLINSYCYSPNKVRQSLNEIVDFHNIILWELFPDKGHQVYVAVNELLFQLEEFLDISYSDKRCKIDDNVNYFNHITS